MKKMLLLFGFLLSSLISFTQDSFLIGYSYAPSILGASAYSCGNEVQLRASEESIETLDSSQYYLQIRFIVPSSYTSMYIPVAVN